MGSINKNLFFNIIILSAVLMCACDNGTSDKKTNPGELTLLITSPVVGPTSANSIPVDFTFSRDVTGFTAEDVIVTNGIIDDFDATSQSDYSAILIPDEDGPVTITVDAGAAEDLSGNLNPEAQLTFTYDTTPPGDVDLLITEAGSGSIDLSWTEPDDPNYDHVLITWSPGGVVGITASAGTTSMQITGLSTGNEYSITIVAYDAADNHSGGKSISITMPADSVPVHQIADETSLVESITVTENRGDAYILESDLDLAGYDAGGGVGWVPVGTETEPFTGTFNGNGHVISNLTINNPSDNYQGFFGYIDADAKIDSLVLEDVDVTGKNYTGALAGKNSGMISYCSVTGTLTGSLEASGLVGWNAASGTITDSQTDVTINGTSLASGLVGINQGTISSCRATGSVTGTSSSSGLVGANHGPIINSYATGSVTGTLTVGGLVGQNYSDGSVINSYATGNVNGEQMSAGLVSDSSGYVSGCYATGTVTSSVATAGGLFARIMDGTVEDCYSRCNVTAPQQVGGISGVIYPSTGVTVIISHCYETGTVSGTTDIGGFVGRISLPAQVVITTCIFNNANTDNGYGTAATLADMKLQTTFAGWDFNGIWAIDATNTINNGYPYLRAIPPTP